MVIGNVAVPSGGMRRFQVAALATLLVVGVGLRLGLALANTEANDDHIEVVEIIADRGVIPTAGDCWECYQPKLFHWSVAKAANALGLESYSQRASLGQGLSFAAGAATLALLTLLALRLPVPIPARVAAFALVALNPRLTAISAQATNDSLAILWGTATVTAFWFFLESGRARYMVWTGLAVILMCLTKGQGLVFLASVLAALALSWLAGGRPGLGRRRLGLALAGLAFASALTVPFLGPYYRHYRERGEALVMNPEWAPAPHWVEQTIVRSPGVRSVTDAFLTFRLWNMLEQPFVTTRTCMVEGPDGTVRFGHASPNPYAPPCAEHRTSFWSQLYGRSQSIRFVRNPPTWVSREPEALALTRALLVLGLLPLGLLLYATALEARRLASGLRERGLQWLAADHGWVWVGFTVSVLLLVARLVYLMRFHATMKAIYLFPAAGCLMILLARALGRLEAHRRPLPALLYAGLGALVLLYGAEASWLLVDLTRARLSR